MDGEATCQGRDKYFLEYTLISGRNVFEKVWVLGKDFWKCKVLSILLGKTFITPGLEFLKSEGKILIFKKTFTPEGLKLPVGS